MTDDIICSVCVHSPILDVTGDRVYPSHTSADSTEGWGATMEKPYSGDGYPVWACPQCTQTLKSSILNEARARMEREDERHRLESERLVKECNKSIAAVRESYLSAFGKEIRFNRENLDHILASAKRDIARLARKYIDD